MFLSAMLTSLPVDFATALRHCRDLGFTHVDVVALAERTAEDLEALAESGLLVSCAAVGRDLPEGCVFDAADDERRRRAVELAARQLEDAARLGATHAYLVPGLDASPAGLQQFAHSVEALLERAGQLRLQLCLEHIPARALPTAQAALAWMEPLPQLKLLLDIGHCLISAEEPAEIVARAADRLGYVHLDDNDGQDDLHWPLLTGKLSAAMLSRTLAALGQSSYAGALAFELNPQNADPVGALQAGKKLVESEI